jgi:hypothetical protein
MSVKALQNQAAATRAELGATLDAIEDKLNVPKQVSRGIAAARTSIDKDPRPWIIGAAVSVVVVTGLAVGTVLLKKD